MDIDLDARYTVNRWEGIAFYLLGPVMVRDEDYEWTGIEEPSWFSLSRCYGGR